MLVLLVVARSFGGKATVGEHVGAAALAVAPAVLLLGAYIPDMTGTVSAPVAVAIATFGRVVALVGIVWCVAVLIKTMATAHNFGMWKSIGAVALTIVVIYVGRPTHVIARSGLFGERVISFLELPLRFVRPIRDMLYSLFGKAFAKGT